MRKGETCENDQMIKNEWTCQYKKRQLQHAWLIVSNHSPLGGSRTRRSKSPWLLTHVVKQHCLGVSWAQKFECYSPIQSCEILRCVEILFDISNAARWRQLASFLHFPWHPNKNACYSMRSTLRSHSKFYSVAEFPSFNQWLANLKDFFQLQRHNLPATGFIVLVWSLSTCQTHGRLSWVSICSLRQAFGLTGVPANANLMEKHGETFTDLLIYCQWKYGRLYQVKRWERSNVTKFSFWDPNSERRIPWRPSLSSICDHDTPN